MTVPEPHPAALLFPAMSEAELSELAEDIRAHGLLEPIVLHGGLVLDGRNRLEACRIAGIEPLYEEWEADGVSPFEYVVAKNLHRRHLTTAQRAALAVELLPHLEAQARERMLAGRRDPESFSAQGPNASAKKAAELVGIGPTSVKTTKAIHKKAPEIVDEMRKGDITIAQAERKAGYAPATTHASDSAPISDSEPRVYYGKGDKFRESTEPLRRYLKAWAGRNYEFRHVNPSEATRRLKVLNELLEGIESARADLATRNTPARMRV